MMSRNNRVGHIIKALVTVVTLLALPGRFGVTKATLDDMLRRTRGTPDAIGPAQFADGLRTLPIIDQPLDIDL